MLKRLIFIVLAACLMAAPGAPASAQVSDADTTAISDILQRLSLGVEAKDEAAFLDLFFRPDAPLARTRPADSMARERIQEAMSFIAGIADSPAEIRLNIEQAVIETHETTGTVTGRIRYLSDQVVQFEGPVVLTLIETAQSWRITSIVWTQFNPGDPLYQASPHDLADIETMIADYARAFRDKDESGFLRLFARADAPFASTRPDALANRPISRDAQREIEFITDMPMDHDEVFSDVSVEIHDTIAIMRSPYQFIMSGQLYNDGFETWSLLHTRSGWKIIAVVWSTTLR